MKNTKEIQFWENIEQGKCFILDSRFNTNSAVWLKNGSYPVKFNPQVTGTASLLERKKYENVRHLWNSVRDGTRRLYTPSTEKFDGYSQFPRPVTNFLGNMKQHDRNKASIISKLRRLKNNNFFNTNLPMYLTNRQPHSEMTQRLTYVISLYIWSKTWY